MKIKNKIIALMISLIAIPNISLAQTKAGETKFGIDDIIYFLFGYCKCR